MTLKFLIEKELKQIFRNPFLPKLFVLLPTMMLLIMPWAANQEVKGVRVAVQDNDKSSYSQRLINKIQASKYFSIVNISETNEQALQSMEKGKSDIIVDIPRNFEKNLITSNETATIMLNVNSVNGTKGALGSSYLQGIVSDFSDDLRAENGLKTAKIQIPNVQMSPYYVYNSKLDYKVFMIPAFMVMMLTLLAGFLPALNIVGEKEKGTMEQMNVTPVGKFSFILSKLIPYWGVGFFVLAYSIFLSWLIYGLLPVGNIFTIFLFATIYILAVSGLGLIISNYSNTMIQAMFLMFFFLVIFILMSGLFTPVSSMPNWAQAITIFNPLRYLMEVFRMVYLKGSAFINMLPQFFALCGFAVILNLWAVISYKKTN